MTPPTTIVPTRYPWRIALAITVALFGTLAAIWWYQDWAAEQDFQVALAETDALDPGWRLEDILAARPVIADDQNSATIVAKVYSAFPRSGFSVGTVLEDEIESQSTSRPMNFQLGVPQIAALRKRLEPLAALRVEAHQLKDMPNGRLRVDYDRVTLKTWDWSLHEVRQVHFFLGYDLMLRADERSPAGVAGTCRAAINVCRAIGDEPSIFAVRTRILCLEAAVYYVERALAQCELPPHELRALQELVRREIEEPKMLRAMRGERATGLRIVEAIRNGSIEPPRPDTTPGWRGWVSDWLPASRNVDRARYLRTMNQLVEASKLPMEDQIDAVNRIDDAWKDRDALLYWQLSTCIKTSGGLHVRNQAKLRCMMVALAAECYRQERGAWPNSLEALVTSGHLQAIPADPYNGELLRCRRLIDGFLVYSVGADCIDNGGVLNRERPVAPGADIGFQLWDADLRRLPAPVEPEGGS